MKLPELKNRLKKKYIVTVAAGVLCVSLIGGTVSAVTVKAEKTNKADATTEAVIDEAEAVEVGKEENVYLLTDATGSVYKTIVTAHLVNENGDKTLSDVSNLDDIENVKGDESFKQSGDSLTWAANGNDIYYQGTSKEEAPITQKITYYLDGEEKTPEEIAGASGRVTIRFDYENNTSYTETVDGEKVTVKVPFTAVTALLLDDKFTNVEVVNGKVQANGSSNVVMGYALPGLKESLDVKEEDFDGDVEFPEYFEVSADVENFELSGAVTMVANAADVISEKQTTAKEDASLDDSINKLSDASTQLQDGSAELAAGVDKLNDAAPTLSSGMSNLSSGLKSYTSGVATINENMPALVAGVNKVVGTMQTTGNTVKAGALAKVNGNTSLMTVLSRFGISSVTESNIDATITAVINNKAAIQAAITPSVTAAIKEQAYAGVAASQGLTAEQVKAIYEDATNPAHSAIVSAVDGIVSSNLSAQLETQYYNILGGLYQAKGAIEAGNTINAQVSASANDLNALTSGMNQVAEGVATLAGNNATLNSGASQLVAGTAALESGVGELDAGAHKLADGVVQFNEEGINELVNLYKGDLKPLTQKLQACLDAGSDYQTFSGKNADVKGNVKFVYRIDSIKAE